MNLKIDLVAVSNLDREPEMHAFMFGVAKAAAELARSFSPVDKGNYIAAHYAVPSVGSHARASFGNNDRKVWWIEYGAQRPNSYFKPRRVLRRAAEAMGLDYHDAKGQ